MSILAELKRAKPLNCTKCDDDQEAVKLLQYCEKEGRRVQHTKIDDPMLALHLFQLKMHICVWVLRDTRFYIHGITPGNKRATFIRGNNKPLAFTMKACLLLFFLNCHLSSFET